MYAGKSDIQKKKGGESNEKKKNNQEGRSEKEEGDAPRDDETKKEIVPELLFMSNFKTRSDNHMHHFVHQGDDKKGVCG